MRQEVDESEARVASLEERMQTLLLPKDPNEGRNVIMEIRGAVGGDEANLFARVLYDMYLRYAALKKWKVEVLSEDASDKDGINEAVFLVKGPDAYIRLEHEAGTHRVQRVPVTEAKGRIHTSTATVTVLPEAEEVEIDIDPNDLKIDVYRSTGPGGQSVNTTDSAVRITHLPTGTVVAMQDEKSQIQNRAKAMVVLRARLLKAEQDRQAAAMSAQRRGQVGAGNRTDKIRTYNFKENRVTDHRINLTLYKLDQVLAGDLERAHRRADGRQARPASSRARRTAGSDGPGGGTLRSPWSNPRLRAGASRPAARTNWPRWRAGPGTRPASSSTRCSALGPGRRAAPACVPAGPAAAARAMAARRAAGEPLQYIFGHWPFRGLDLRVDPRVLIPRPETEQVVEVALGEAAGSCRAPRRAGLVVVDAGTGSGAIALALATELGPDMVRGGLGHRHQSPARSTRGRSQPGGVPRRRRRRGAGGLPRVELAEGSWLDAAAGAACGARWTWWSRTRPTWRGGMGRVGRRGAGRAPAGAGRRPRPRAARPVWPTWRPCSSEARRWLGRPGAVVVELAPHQAGPAQRPGPATRVRRGTGRVGPGGPARALWWRGRGWLTQ